jgi:hypothetical protein
MISRRNAFLLHYTDAADQELVSSIRIENDSRAVERHGLGISPVAALYILRNELPNLSL